VPLSFAVFSHVLTGPPAGVAYRAELELFVHAEELGFDGVWVRQFHLRSDDVPGRGGLPSPFVFLAALAARTRRIQLGPAAVVLPLEDPLRVAEDAAVLDALSGGRLQLGLANGGTAPGLAEAFAPDLAELESTESGPARRRERYEAQLARLRGALDGDPVTADGQRLNPAATGLGERLWQATLTTQSAVEAARQGHGILVGTTQTVPAENTCIAYLGALPPKPEARISASTAIYPARDRASALREAAADIEAKYAWGAAFLGPAETVEEKAEALNLHYGTADDIAESIMAKPYFRYLTQLNVQVEYGYADFRRRAEALELFVTDVAPQLRQEVRV
jgi:alkanesulfonate monooxygenase SsuD/methylene tetrahydromethanopterin reductase-like flavin-dependent oxidoreductase (luciferase family)